ncbi:MULTISPECIES: IclR family transcriptional regulator [unclassified Shinella]|uniref:IclR family transcriptional regulator n=1 Tax=unclassified Shinella TaxID=2643062 RepID=UPI00234E914B|nr:MULTISPECIES: IclR family transcriptional regulator [unclassified Shinella]MCO5149552.1 IclR family transcriptional regulator [Shinella sp.]MDC7262543.1 IclR family transcriptional regulator [Shinella sp. HY16]MDC7269438.1 IclR family transcriptional regulator [Shinella sp. YZ44]
MSKTKENGSEKGSNPLRRIATVLDAVAFSSSGLTLQDIANAAQIPVSSAHRITNTLLDVGYLEAAPNKKVYLTGPRLRRLLNLSFGDAPIEKIASPLLTELANKLQEVAFICRLVAGKIKLEAFAFPQEAPSSLIHPGYEFPFHATASGKAMLAFQNEDFIADVLSADIPRFQAGTTVDRAEIRQQLDAARQRGYAVNDMEFDPGVFALAAPVTFEHGDVFLTVGIVGMSARMHSRFEETEMATFVKSAAGRLSHLLSSHR